MFGNFPLDNPSRLRQIRRVFDDLEFAEQSMRQIFGCTDHEPFSSATQLASFDHRLRNTDPLEMVVRLFRLGFSENSDLVANAVKPTDVQDWIDAGLLKKQGDRLAAQVRLFPIADLLFAADRRENRNDANVVLGLTDSALTLAKLMVKRPGGNVLDLGTGCGVLAIYAEAQGRRVVATDVNARAIQFTQFNAQLNGSKYVEARLGPFFEPVESEVFDIIVSNPPFVISPKSIFVFRDAGMRGDAVSEMLIREAPRYLADGGIAQIIFNCAHFADQGPELRLAKWVHDSGCDAWAMSFGVRDLASYATEWIRDTGDDDATSFEKWMRYYANEGITAISPGIMMLRKRRGVNWFHFEPIPQLKGSCGEAVELGFALRDVALGFDDEKLLQTVISLSDAVELRQELSPSDQGWNIERASLRLAYGLSWEANIDGNLLTLASAFRKPCRIGDALTELCRNLNMMMGEVLPSALKSIRELMIIGILVLAKLSD